MNKLETALEALKGSGQRLTNVRKQLLAIFVAAENPLTPIELQQRLVKRHLPSNKTTIYRQLETLVKYNIIQEVQLADRTKRYELASGEDHHHHLVCLSCGTIDEVSFKDDLERQERLIRSQKKFKIVRHMLEFFGYCARCQKKHLSRGK